MPTLESEVRELFHRFAPGTSTLRLPSWAPADQLKLKNICQALSDAGYNHELPAVQEETVRENKTLRGLLYGSQAMAAGAGLMAVLQHGSLETSVLGWLGAAALMAFYSGIAGLYRYTKIRYAGLYMARDARLVDSACSAAKKPEAA